MRASLLLALALGLAACDEPGPELAGEGEPCDVEADCEAELDCIGSVCTAPPECLPGETACGAICCGTAERCVDGACERYCATGAECGSSCCTADETCLDGQCCGPARICGESCCSTDEECVDGACISCPRELCGGRECCRDEEVCHNGSCCVEEAICGDSCCDEGEACELGACHPDCGEAARCGEPEACCGAGEVCYLRACVLPSGPCDDRFDCEAGEYCDLGLGLCLPRGEATDCELAPETGVFEPVVAWEWTTSTVLPDWHQVDMAPAVVSLDDDDGDGRVGEGDVPDIVFIAFRAAGGDAGIFGDGVLRAISGDGRRELFTVADPTLRVNGGASVAVADIDGDGLPEILTCRGVAGEPTGPLVAFSNEGELEWQTDDPRVHCGATAPAVGDVEGDGSPEILVRYTLVDAGGEVIWSGPSGTSLASADDFTTLADIDGDGELEVVGGSRAYDGDGALLWEDLDPASPDGYPAVADLDLDGEPELVVVSSLEAWDVGSYPIPGHWIYARELDATGSLMWGPFDVNQGMPTPSGPGGGGPPTVADFDGDGAPEVAAAGGYGYVVFEGESGEPVWFEPTVDLSSRVTGSAVFDFEGDGAAEVVYADEHDLRIYRGSDGEVLFEICATSGTLWQLPVVADVDGDEHAEVVVVGDTYLYPTCADGVTPGFAGIRVLEDALDNWVRTRPIWNQHTYHVTNVEPDGSIPATERHAWEVPGLNSFRQNLQPDGLLSAPDLVPTDLEAGRRSCPTSLALAARVLNAGAASAPSGVAVAFHRLRDDATEELLGTTSTTRPLLPGESEVVTLTAPLAEADLDTALTFFVVIDPAPAAAHECREDNNRSEPFEGHCEALE